MASETPPYWVLISILSSSFPMEAGLAMALHRVALELYQCDTGVGLVDYQLTHGRVKNLRKEAAIGAITGPVFEAQLETERGRGHVGFLLTREGLQLSGHAPPEVPPRLKN